MSIEGGEAAKQRRWWPNSEGEGKMEWLKNSKKKEKKKNERGMEVAVVGNRLIALYSWVPIKLLLDKSDVMRLRDN